MTSRPLKKNIPSNSSEVRDKKTWRACMLRERVTLFADSERYADLSARLQRRLLDSDVWRSCPNVLLYVAVRGEVDTRLLLSDAWGAGKNVYLPRCVPDRSGEMEMLNCGCPEDLVLSPVGIPEPPISAVPLTTFGSHTLMVVPGLAFDGDGFRIGYGGGYYDRLMAHALQEIGDGGESGSCETLCNARPSPPGPACSGLISVGLVFTAHLFKHLPRDPWDIPVAGLCTEENLTWL